MDNNIKELLAKKHKKIREMFKITRDITSALEKEDAEGVADLYEIRRDIIDEVDNLDDRLSSFFAGDVKKLRRAISEDYEAKGIYDILMGDLRKLAELDKENLRRAEGFKGSIAENIAGLNKTESALKGYGFMGVTTQDGAFIDTKK